MAGNSEDIKVLEKCRVAPPPDAVAEFTVPLSFFDMRWLISDAEHHLHFYRFRHPCPNSKFIISSIKSSLSLVLKHFLPLAGNLIWPVDSSDRMPELRYKKGDSVSLTIAESSMDFDYLAGDHQRDSYKFNDLIPQLPEPIVTSGDEVLPLFALQVTVFSNTGICIGRNLHQVLGDASSFLHFNKLWVLVDKSNGDSLKFLPLSSLPMYDRSVVQDPFHIRRKIYNERKLLKSQGTPTVLNPAISKDEVRATFILHPIDIMKLKKFISSKNRNLTGSSNYNLSTFTVTSALIWTCLSKSLDTVVREKVEEDKHAANLCAFINCRQRFAPPIPQNYFGNCIVPCMVGSTHEQLVGNEGLSVAATAIGDAIHKRLHDYEGILRGDWISPPRSTSAAPRSTLIYVVGSAQRNVHDFDADFGWGKLEKHESVSTNPSATLILISRSRRFKGALELGISLPKNRMDAFATIFTNFINSLHVRSPL
uniref:Acyltransferase homolog n=1 Tax=Gentiana triflora TaxID=55190 RepID=Q9MBD5_GENTR|nr:acyltransferase homolog [Gentiana triflora]